MTGRPIRWLPIFLLTLLGLSLAGPAVQAGDRDRGRDRVDGLIEQLRYARDNDDREDAAEDLGKISDRRALDALRRAAVYDREDDVRDEARKAIKRIHRRDGDHEKFDPEYRREVRVYRTSPRRTRVKVYYDYDDPVYDYRHYRHYPRHRVRVYWGWDGHHGRVYCY